MSHWALTPPPPCFFVCSMSKQVDSLTQWFKLEPHILTGGFKQSAKPAASCTSIKLFAVWDSWSFIQDNYCLNSGTPDESNNQQSITEPRGSGRRNAVWILLLTKHSGSRQGRRGSISGSSYLSCQLNVFLTPFPVRRWGSVTPPTTHTHTSPLWLCSSSVFKLCKWHEPVERRKRRSQLTEEDDVWRLHVAKLWRALFTVRSSFPPL